MDHNILLAFLLTLFAGLSTGIGSCIAVFANRTNAKLLTFSLGFSAGVMLYVSFVEIFFKAKESLITVLGVKQGSYVTVLFFFIGMLFIGLIDYLVPNMENPHEVRRLEDICPGGRCPDHVEKRLMRMGLFTALAIAVHNFPEGLATFVSTLQDPQLGISVAIAIAIHNIPEGISVAVPVFYATQSRKKSFYYSFLSGLAEPIGALIGYFVLRSIFNDMLFGFLFAFVAGIMVYISLDELLPAAEEYGEHHVAITGVVLGMVVMAMSLLVFL